MQEINNDIAGILRTPNVAVTTPTEALEQNVRIADVAAQVRQRKAEAADYAARAPLRNAQTLAQTQQLAEDTALKQAFSKALKPYDPAAGDLQFDDNVAGQTLDSIQIPGIGPASYLRGRYQTEKDSQLASHRTQTLKEAGDYIVKIKMAATPAENFLAIEDPKEQAKQYPSVREAVVRTDPAIAKQFPYELTDENRPTVIAKLQQIASHKKIFDDMHTQLTAAEDRQKLAVATPEGKANALKALDQSTADRLGVTVDKLDQEQKDANYKEIYGSAVVRKAPVRLQLKVGTVNGEPAAANYNPVTGQYIDEEGKEVSNFTPGKLSASDEEFNRDVDGAIKTNPKLSRDQAKDIVLRQHFEKKRLDLANAAAQAEGHTLDNQTKREVQMGLLTGPGARAIMAGLRETARHIESTAYNLPANSPFKDKDYKTILDTLMDDPVETGGYKKADLLKAGGTGKSAVPAATTQFSGRTTTKAKVLAKLKTGQTYDQAKKQLEAAGVKVIE